MALSGTAIYLACLRPEIRLPQYRALRPRRGLSRPFCAHLPAAEEPDYAVEASMTSRNAVERPALTAIRRYTTRA